MNRLYSRSDSKPSSALSRRKAKRMAGSPTLCLLLLLFFSVNTFTVGSAADQSADIGLIQILKLLALAVILVVCVARLMPHSRGLGSIRFVFRELHVIWLSLLLFAILLPFSFFVEISMRKLFVTVLGVFCLHLMLANYVLLGTYGLRDLLARHMLFIFCALSIFALVSILLLSSLGLRVGATAELVHPNILASLLGLGILHAFQYKKIATSTPLTGIPAEGRLIVILIGGPIFLILLSRGALIALLMSSLVFMVESLRRGRVLAMFLSLAIVYFAAIIWLENSDLINNVLSRGQTIQDVENLTGRTLVWESIWSGIKDSRLFVGFGYAITFPSYSFSLGSGSVFGAHNTYLQSLASGGIAGLALFIFYIIKQLQSSLKMLRNDNANTYFMSVSVFIAVNCFSESLFAATLSSPFAIFICSQLCVAILNRRTVAARSPLFADANRLPLI